MKKFGERFLAWFLCMCIAVIIGGGVARVGELIPVRGDELPGRAVEIFSERVTSGKACPPIPGELDFDEPHLVRDGRFVFVTGYFRAPEAPEFFVYRYRIILYDLPFTDWYLYDAGSFADYPRENIEPDEAIWVSQDCLLFHYSGEVSLTEAHITRSFNANLGFPSVLLLILLLRAVLEKILGKFDVMTPGQQRALLRSIVVVLIVLEFFWFAMNNPQASWQTLFDNLSGNG